MTHATEPVVTDADLVDADVCPVCGAAGAREVVGACLRQPRVDLLCCPRCHAASASRMPSADFLSRFYRDSYGPQHVAATQRNAEHLTQHIVRVLALPAHTGTLRVLDYGGNDGGLAVRIAQRWLAQGTASAVDIVVVDFVPPVSPSDARVTVRTVAELPASDGGFDVVLASAVLEHVPQLQLLLPRLFAQLSPGGRMYARTPYMAPVSRALRRLLPHFPAHVHDLGAAFWESVPRTFSLNVQVMRSAPSTVETLFRETPLHTSLAHLLKLPARLQRKISPTSPLRWTLVGGWEVVMLRPWVSA